jgi:large subunit ribosomal protein L31
MKLAVCNACHPYYTGRKGRVIEAGRLEKFRQKYAGMDYGQRNKNAETAE